MEDCSGLISNASFAGEGEDVDKLLQDEMLDSCDSPAIRKIVKSSFMAIFADLCKRIDEKEEFCAAFEIMAITITKTYSESSHFNQLRKETCIIWK